MSMLNYFTAAIDGDFNTAGNWTENQIPEAGHVAYFDSRTATNCTLSSAVSCDGLIVDGYTGTLNLNRKACTFGSVNVSSGTLAGNGTNVSCGGDFIISGLAGYSAPTITFTGSGTYDPDGEETKSPTFNGSTTIAGNTTINAGTTTVAAAATVDIAGTISFTGAGTLTLGNGSALTGTGTIDIDSYYQHPITRGTSVSIECNLKITDPDSSYDVPGGTYGGNVEFESTAYTNEIYFADDVVFAGGMTCTNNGGTLDVSNDSTNVDVTFQGDVTIGASVTWTKGTGAITISGGNTQSVDFAGETIEDLTVNKSSGTVNFTEAFTADAFTGTSGHIVFYPSKTFTTAGNLTLSSGCTSNPNETSLDVNGDFSADGQDWSTVVDTWYLDVAGASTMANCDVKNCDSTAGSDTTAGRRSANLGGNSGVIFQNPNIPTAQMLCNVG